ncbi:MAG: hypothetical protein ACR2QK_21505 [Acidimicrobiales bacterium]
MNDLLETSAARFVAYGLAAAACFVAERRERHQTSGRPGESRHGFWLAAGVLLVLLGTMRAVGVASVAADIGSAQARSLGWYDRRSPIQILVGAAVATGWLIAVVTVLRRVGPSRRRRHLAAAVVLLTIVVFATARFISLHRIDAFLERTGVIGIELGTLVELSLLAGLFVITIPLGMSTSGSRRPGPSDGGAPD